MASHLQKAPTHAGAGALLGLIRASGATTRSELIEATGLSRSTVSDRVDALILSDLVREAGATPSDGGRPRGTLEFNPAAGVVLVADLGASHACVALMDLAGGVIAQQYMPIAVADGPLPVLGAVHERFGALLGEAGRGPPDVRGVGVGLPGPVAFSTGRLTHPPLMPGWHGFGVRDWFADRYRAPVVVDNDVNVMAFGEQQTWYPDCEHLLFVKVGTGIGCGIIAGGRVMRGAQGAAGDIGHIRVSGHDDARCSCGNAGCLEAVASGSAIAARLTRAGHEAAGSVDVVRLVLEAHPLANRLVREAGRCLGEALADCVSLFNPGAIVIGGPILEASQPLLAGVREVTILRAPPLATRHLRIAPSRLGGLAGVVGAGLMVREMVLAPDAIELLLLGL